VLPAWLNGWGATAFFLASVALLFAAFALPRFLTLILSGLGLLVGLAGVVASLQDRKVKDVVWLALGGGGGGLLLLLASFAPSLLNAEWGMDFDVAEPDLNKQVMVSRDNKSEVKELTDRDRVDATTNAIRQGDVFVRVESVVVDGSAEKDKPALLIALHVANVGPLHNVTYHGQASGEHAAVARDSRGKEIPTRNLGPSAKKLGQLKTVSILPNHEVTDLLAFEAPWLGTECVEVDLPSAAWGRQGVCKFKISRSAIVQKTRKK
jgi:hypothetical protein